MITQGIGNTAMGRSALGDLTDGVSNTAMGLVRLATPTGFTTRPLGLMRSVTAPAGLTTSPWVTALGPNVTDGQQRYLHRRRRYE